jgi:hypothetical protein
MILLDLGDDYLQGCVLSIEQMSPPSGLNHGVGNRPWARAHGYNMSPLRG